jgi:hypothetical protein
MIYLARSGEAEHKHNAQRQFRLVGAMRPQSVRARGDTHRGDGAEDQHCKFGRLSIILFIEARDTILITED